MSLMVKRFFEGYNANFLLKEFEEMRTDIMANKFPDEEIFTPFIKVREFKAIHNKFYGSRDMMKEFIQTYTARRLRIYCQVYPQIKMEQQLAIMTQSEKLEWEAADEAVKRYTKRFGPVSLEDVKEMDDLVHSWWKLAHDQLQGLAEAQSQTKQ